MPGSLRQGHCHSDEEVMRRWRAPAAIEGRSGQRSARSIGRRPVYVPPRRPRQNSCGRFVQAQSAQPYAVHFGAVVALDESLIIGTFHRPVLRLPSMRARLGACWGLILVRQGPRRRRHITRAGLRHQSGVPAFAHVA
jgi:hypothetical protein